MVKEFGSGVFLDEQLDFSIDSTGDIQSTNGVEELEKDLSVQMLIGLKQYTGSPPSGNLRAKVKNTARNIAIADARVLSINSGGVEISFSRDRKQINIKMVVQTTNAEQELVFSVE